MDTAACQPHYASYVGVWLGQQVVANSSFSFAQYGVLSTLPPVGPVFNKGYVHQAGPALVHTGAPPPAGLQECAEHAFRSAYYQAFLHACGNASSATKFSGGGGLRAGPFVPQPSYRHEMFHGGSVGREVSTFSEKEVDPA